MREIKGNLLHTELHHIIHGCNALGVMGAGVALAIKNEWPEAYTAYRKGIEEYRSMPTTFASSPLGMVFSANCGQTVIHNAVTQLEVGTAKKQARYYAVVDAIRNVIESNGQVDNYAIPKIGCGLGGCDWNIMKVLLTELEIDFGVEFWVYDL